MSNQELISVGEFHNDTKGEIRLYLEMLGEEVVMSPGHRVELLARQSAEVMPLTFSCVEGGIQVHPHKEFDPGWHVRFEGRIIKAGHPTVLSAHMSEASNA